MAKKHITGEGHGQKGHFAGLSNDLNSKIAILPVAFDLTTTYQKGTRKGPAAIIEASRNLELYDIDTDSSVHQLGISTEKEIKKRTSETMLKAVFDKTSELIEDKKFVVVLGGEHSISFASIKAHAEHYKKLTVLQLDAHADLQNAYEENLWSHASVMKRVQEIPQVSKIVSVGIRSLAESEIPNLQPQCTFFSHQLDRENKWMDQVIAQLKSPVYITFDVDVFDSALMPSTGTPEPGGLDWNTTITFLKKVTKSKKIIGFDVVELSPRKGAHAPDYLAAKLVYKLLSFIFNPKKL